MKKPNKTVSDLTPCSIPPHAVMMHITKTSLENRKRKVIPETFQLIIQSNFIHSIDVDTKPIDFNIKSCKFPKFHTSPETCLAA